jgi:hypothetical protein
MTYGDAQCANCGVLSYESVRPMSAGSRAPTRLVLSGPTVGVLKTLGSALNLWTDDVNLLFAGLAAAGLVLGLPLLSVVFATVGHLSAGLALGLLLWVYTGSAMGGRIMGALNSAGKFSRFWADGFAYMPRCLLILLGYLLLWICVGIVLLTPIFLIGGFSLASSNDLLNAASRLPAVIAVELLFLMGLSIWLTPYGAMMTAGAFHDGVNGLRIGIQLGRSHRWPILGLLLILSIANVVVIMVASVLGEAGLGIFGLLGALANPSSPGNGIAAVGVASLLVWVVVCVGWGVLYASFVLTTLLIYYRSATVVETAPRTRMNPSVGVLTS